MYTSVEEFIGDNIGKGVALLDERIPEWRNYVAIDDLDMESCTHCILGQVGQGLDLGGDDHWDAYSRLTKRLDIHNYADQFGFDIPDYGWWGGEYTEEQMWEMMDEMWRQVLQP